ncbi:MAG: radical SAM protein [Deltaproteobacteria bacterium]|nr:radical SAM protein [Deltaproteobacteria bacterium]
MSSRQSVEPWLRQHSVWRSVEHLAAGRSLPAPVTVELQLGTECNLACPECISRPLPGPGRFVPARATEIARELVALGVRCVVLSGGGEPLLHPEAGAVLQTLAAGGVATALVTNGTLLHTQLDAIAECAARVRVSVDAATSRTHGRFRPSRAGDECFPTVVANLGALARRMRGQLTFSFLVISRRDATSGVVESNAGEIVAAARLAREAGCHAFDVNLAFDRRPWIDPAHSVVARTLADQVESLRELDGPEFRVCVGDLVEAVAAGRADPIPPAPGYARCPAAEIRAAVAPGGVFLCPRHMSLVAACYGDPVTTPLAEIWASGARGGALGAVDPRRHCAGACMSMGLNEELLRAIDEARRGRQVALLPDTDLFM